MKKKNFLIDFFVELGSELVEIIIETSPVDPEVDTDKRIKGIYL